MLKFSINLNRRVFVMRCKMGMSKDKYGNEFRLRGYKTFFMLNSAEHEIGPANKSKINNNLKFFLAK